MEDILARLRSDTEIRGFSNHTIGQYQRRIGAYLRYIDKPWQESDEQDILDYIQYLKNDRKLANGTINTYISAVCFFTEVTCDKAIRRKRIPYLKRPKRLPEILSRAEVMALIDVTGNTKHKAWFMLAYSAGLRRSEIATLKISDIDSKSMRIFVRAGKGDKDRYTLLSKTCLAMLRRYWKGFRPDNPNGYLFPGKTVKGHINCHTITNAFACALKTSGIKKVVTVHTLRHCFATHLLENGTSLMDIKELLGHTSFASTMIYLHLANISDRVVSPLDLPYHEEGR